MAEEWVLEITDLIERRILPVVAAEVAALVISMHHQAETATKVVGHLMVAFPSSPVHLMEGVVEAETTNNMTGLETNPNSAYCRRYHILESLETTDQVTCF